jgi:hypothetical protein
MKRFRRVLQNALEKGVTLIPNDMIWIYDDIVYVYRAVKITEGKQEITIEDFIPQAEIPSIANRSSFDEADIENYGTSFNTDLEMLNIILHMPRRNKRIAKGTLKMEYGPIVIDESHIMCFLYEDAHIEDEFEVI